MYETSTTPPPAEKHEEREFLHSEALLRSIPFVPLLAFGQLFAIFIIYFFVLLP
jgi:hypothetical protein